MFKPYGGTVIAGKVGYGLTCFFAAVALMVAGYAYKVVNAANGFGGGIAINGGSSVGAMNILVMGLESRTDYQGNVLSSQLLTAMHAGSVQAVRNHQVGGQATNTLILIHIFAGGQKAAGFSIPRDDLVTFPKPYLGLTQGKIDQAYGFAYEQSLEATVSSSMSSDQRYLLANQAGQAATVATVQSVTGVHIDHFIEVNLAGFFYLAQAFGGIEVCVKPWSGNHGGNLYDNNSGWNAVHDGYNRRKGGAQYLHLAADQSLAFVRDRDTLPGIDLGRTTRQQAVIDYAIWQVKHENIFTDFTLLNSLLATAKSYVITDRHLNLLDFATNLRALSGRNLQFETLVPAGQVNNMPLNGQLQDVNLIDVPATQKLVRDTFYPQPAVRRTSSAKAASTKKAAPVPPASTVTVDVYNGGITPHLATNVSQALVSAGYKAGAVENAAQQPEPVRSATRVFYGAGTAANAAKIARYFAATAVAATSLAAGHVEILLGTTATAVPAALGSSGAATSGTSTSGTTATTPSATSAAGADNGAARSAVTVKANAPYGIPCVY